VSRMNSPIAEPSAGHPGLQSEAEKRGGFYHFGDNQKVRTRKVLLIAFHYPPCGTSSGLQRSLCFSRDLREFGWSPIVLTAHPRAYRETRNDQLAQVPFDVPVHRVFALDTMRHLGIRGRYFGWSALPDHWITWIAGALTTGLRFILDQQPDVIWSTYPLATAHLIGVALHRLTGIPWAADFRDPMTEIDPLTQQRFPTDPRLWSVRRWVEHHTIRYCQRAIFVTPSAMQIYQERYPERANCMRLIENGFDEENFRAAELIRDNRPRKPGSLLLVHSGTLYPGPDRDASSFLAALANLRDAGKISSTTLRVRLRASGYDNIHRERIARYGVGDLVSLEPAISYQAALVEMLGADGLLLFQGSTSNPAVPAKLYEYLRARRPIFALVDERGDTAAALRAAKIGTVVPLDSSELIAAGLEDFLGEVRCGTAHVASTDEIQKHSRKTKARELAGVLEEICPV